MGAVLELEIVESADLADDVATLRRQHGVETIATVLDCAAEPLPAAGRAERIALLFGSEGHGLDDAWIAACDHRVTLPMQRGTDSLNVAVASGIFLYHFAGAK
jgi:tRNA G18 (ribose-2'-O)-methylase SpoU